MRDASPAKRQCTPAEGPPTPPPNVITSTQAIISAALEPFLCRAGDYLSEHVKPWWEQVDPASLFFVEEGR